MIEEYRKEIKNDITVSIKTNELDGIRKRELEKNSARIFKDGKVYSSNFYGQTTDSKLKIASLENDKCPISYDYELECSNTCDKSEGKRLTTEEITKFAQDAIAFFEKEMPGFRITGKVTHENNTKEIKSTSGLDLKLTNIKTQGFVAFKRMGSPNIDDAFFGIQTTDGQFHPEDYQLFVDIHKHFDTVVPLTAGKYPVVFSNSYSGHMSLFQRSLNPESYHAKSAFFSGKLGEKIFNEKVNIVDKRTCTKKGLLNPFNDEGELIEDELTLVKNGVFENILYDKERAKKYDAKSTGSGFRNYDSAVMARDINIDLVSTGESLEDIVNKHEKVIFISLAGGGDTTSNGDYSSPVQLSFLYENGKIVGKLPDLTISNNIKDIFGDDFISVPTTDYEPDGGRLLVSQMNVIVKE